MKHPSMAELALYAGRECGFAERLRLAWHLRSCEACREQVASFEGLRAGLTAQTSELPQGFDWDRLAAEMQANIRLGLVAGAIVEPPRSLPERLDWRAAVVVASLTVAVTTGWFLSVPGRLKPVAPVAAIASTGATLEATSEGIELKDNGGSFTLLAPKTQNVSYTVDAEGAVGARYVDAETGQVTISHVVVE